MIVNPEVWSEAHDRYLLKWMLDIQERVKRENPAEWERFVAESKAKGEAMLREQGRSSSTAG